MPLIVNLFEEFREETGAGKLDLLVVAKRTLVGSILLGLLLTAASWTWAAVGDRIFRNAALEWERDGDQYEELLELNNRGATLGTQAGFLRKRVVERILWAPVLATVADMVPDDTQVTKLTCERKTIEIKPDPRELLRGTAEKPATKAEMDELIRENTRKMRGLGIAFEGLAFGQRAELTVDAFREQLQQFNVSDDFEMAVRLGALGSTRMRVAAGPGEDVKRFIIDCELREVIHGAAS